MKNNINTESLSALYERAWNETVKSYPEWKQSFIIDEPFGRYADEAARDAIKLAEQWERE